MSDRIRLNYDDGYPEGFSLLDNRDIWDGPKRRRIVLSLDALGAYSVMHSLPKGWDFREAWLLKCFGVGRHKLLRILQELEAKNRLSRERVRDANGRFIRTDWMLLRGGNPQSENQTVAKSPREKPQSGFPTSGNSTVGKSDPLISKEEAVSTKKSKTTTTTDSPLDWGSLPQITTEQQVVVVSQMAGLAAERQQEVLDELAGALRVKAIKGQWPGWLHRVVQRAIDGSFKPNHALLIQAERKQRIESQQLAARRQAEAAEREARNSDPAVQAKRKAASEAARKALFGT